MSWRRLNLEAIKRSLGELRYLLPAADPDRASVAFVADVERRLAAGYAYVDRLLAEQVDVMSYGQTRHLLELNHIVLCGLSAERRAQFAAHIAETEKRFFDHADSGIGPLMAWYERNAGRAPRALAAGTFVQVVSTPQLFIEGNRRTATLLASYLLARAGLPPMVVTRATMQDFADLSDGCAAINRGSFGSGYAMLQRSTKLVAYLERVSDPALLRPEVVA